MDTEQARAILRANEVKSRALLNLENAARMSTDDPRSKELLEEAGDAYAKATEALRLVDAAVTQSLTAEMIQWAGSTAVPVDYAP